MNKRSENINLIQLALKGKQKAFKELYERHKHKLFVVCLRYATDRGTAQDYLQETFINVFKKLDQFDITKGVFESWTRRIAINVCLGNIRKQTLYAVNITGAEEIATSDINALSELSMQEMLALIQRLPYGYRTIFNMYVIDGFTHNEIAAELNISPSTSKTQLMKARNLLQKKIIANQRVFTQDHG